MAKVEHTTATEVGTFGLDWVGELKRVGKGYGCELNEGDWCGNQPGQWRSSSIR